MTHRTRRGSRGQVGRRQNGSLTVLALELFLPGGDFHVVGSRGKKALKVNW